MANGNGRELKKTLTTSFTNALRACLEQWEKKPGTDRSTYQKAVTAFWEFCETVSQRQSDAYRIGSDLICNVLNKRYVPVDNRPQGWRREKKPIEHWGVPRELRSVILTALARWPYEALTRGVPIRGRIVSHFGRVLNRTAGRCGAMYVEWFEDMNLGLPLANADPPPEDGYHDWLLAPQSTRMMRGILHSVHLKDGVMDEFWCKAAESETFPERIFTDPGDFERRGCFMTPSQLSELAVFFTYAPEEAVVRFARAFARRVQTMQVVVYARVIMPGGNVADIGLCDPKENIPQKLFGNLGFDIGRICWESDVRFHITLEVKPESRKGLLDAVLSLVQDRERVALLKPIFFPD